MSVRGKNTTGLMEVTTVLWKGNRCTTRKRDIAVPRIE